MVTYSSRHVRPAQPKPITVTERDVAILISVFQHRFLRAQHIHWLHFPGVSLRAAQKRLRQLWAHGFFDRAFLPALVIGDGSSSPRSGGPLYCLAEPGARIVGSALSIPYSEIPSTPAQNQRGYATLSHHLVSTDWLVSLHAVMTGRGGRATLVRERALRSLATRDKRILIPDAAAQLQIGDRAVWTYLEVVRADPRSGTKTILAKMRRYVSLQHERAFAERYGHKSLRRVLFVTTSKARAKRLLALTHQLEAGAQMFAFGSYEATNVLSAPSSFTPDTVLSPMWRTARSDAPSSLLSLLFDHPCHTPAPVQAEMFPKSSSAKPTSDAPASGSGSSETTG